MLVVADIFMWLSFQHKIYFIFAYVCALGKEMSHIFALLRIILIKTSTAFYENWPVQLVRFNMHFPISLLRLVQDLSFTDREILGVNPGRAHYCLFQLVLCSRRVSVVVLFKEGEKDLVIFFFETYLCKVANQTQKSI